MSIRSSRRSFLINTPAAALALAAGAHRILADSPGASPGIQLYTVGADMQKDPAGTLHALRQIGYVYVEAAGFGSLSPADMRKAIDDAGLKCPSAHLRFSSDDPTPLFDQARALGVHYVVSSVLMARPAGSDMRGTINALSSQTADDFKRNAALANDIAHKAKAAGFQYAYHNHNFEFRDLGGGKIGYDILLAETDPDLVKFELDCGWMCVAGKNPVDYFKQHPNRYRMIHVKDFVKGPPTTDLMGANRPKGTELGRGWIDYHPIFAAAQAAGVQYYFSEQEPPFTDMTPLAAAKVDYEYMHSIG
ncbi:MAG TPA: sugar phosphate isomerase/epimerase [Terracidiphilus sp.]|nr:sugar phosphate isomerase/epimerase [Terracidiphilus sp.]